MASLQAPLTIISNSGSIATQPPAATWFDEDVSSLHFVALDARPRAFGIDNGLRESITSRVDSVDSSVLFSSSGNINGSGSGNTGKAARRGSQGSADDADPASEIVRYQAFGLPRPHHHHHHDSKNNKRSTWSPSQGSKIDDAGEDNNKDDSSSTSGSLQPMSAFESAKKAAQDQLKTLSVDISVAFPLPFELATIVNNRNDLGGSIITEDDDTCTTMTGASTVVWSRRIPILAKFSPKMRNGMRFLALQYTPTMVRIATVEGESSGDNSKSDHRNGLSSPAPSARGVGRRHSFSGKLPTMNMSTAPTETGGGNNAVHWTIDLSFDAHPVSSKPEELPNFGGGPGRNVFGKGPKAEEGIVPGTTSIIGGGVLWSARGRDSNVSLDLIVVTTTCVIVYYVNMAKKQLVKTHVFPHDMAASFWHEPITRTLVIGSYKSNDIHNNNNSNNNNNSSNTSNNHNSSWRNQSSNSVTIDDGNNTLLRASLQRTSSQRGSLLASFSMEEEGVHHHYHNDHNQSAESMDNDDNNQDTASFPSAVMEMKTLFFSKTTPSVETFPSFALGTLREVVPSAEEDERHELMLSLETFDTGNMDKKQQKKDEESAVVLPTEIFMVNLYGAVYCVELGSLGSGKGIGLTKLDRENRCIHVRQQNFDGLKGGKVDVESSISVGVIDNLLCIFAKNEETTHLLDVADLFSEDQRIFRQSIEHFDHDLHSASLSFLAPSYFLDTSGQGLLYEVALSLPLVLQNVPPAECIIPFLLRRNAPRAAIQKHVMDRFSAVIKLRDMSTLRKWIGVIVDQYSKSEDAQKFDFESTVGLLSKSSLISLDDMIEEDDSSLLDGILVPASCSQLLTQTEMLQMILLRHAMSALREGDSIKLKFISSLSAYYFVELERRFLTPCVALQCLVIALLWRSGENAELTSFLSARQSQWTISRRRKQLNLPTAGRMMYFDNPGAIAFAETLFTLATEESVDKASKTCAPSTARQLISHATIILLGCGATALAVKCLLSAGQLNDAIIICSKRLKPGKGDLAEDMKVAAGIQAKDFYRTAISNARKQSSVAERCKSLYLLHCFLQQWDPRAFELDSRKIRVSRRGPSAEQRRRTSFLSGDDFDSMVVEQSILAHECPRFPDELFGGKDSVCCQRLRTMFGYVHNRK